MRRKKATESYRKAVTEREEVAVVLQKAKQVEDLVKSRTPSGTLSDATVANFYDINAPLLEKFIQVRMWNAKSFHKVKLLGLIES